MNIHEIKNAADKVEGYLLRHPADKDGEAFARAKAECMKHLRRQLECIEGLTREQYRSAFKSFEQNAA